MATHEGRSTWHLHHVANSREEDAEAFAGEEEEEEGFPGAVGEAVVGAEAFLGAEAAAGAEEEVEEAEATGVIVTVGQAEGEREEEEEDGILGVEAISLSWL